MSNVTSLTKMSLRSLRKPCPACGSEGPFYEAETQDGRRVLAIANTFSRDQKQGDSLPLSYLHTCGNNTNGVETGNQGNGGEQGQGQGNGEQGQGGEQGEQQGQGEQGNGGEQNGGESGQGGESGEGDAQGEGGEETQGDESSEGDSDESDEDDDESLFKKLQEILGKGNGVRGSVDRAEVEQMIKDALKGVQGATQTFVVHQGETRPVTGKTHKQFGDVLKLISTKENVQLVGGPGTGKTHMCAQVAEALGLPFYSIGYHLQSTASELKGYMDAQGRYVPTNVYTWATNPEGGLFLNDELDRAHGGILAGLNALLSNRYITFPNGETVHLTDNHVIIACTNTPGDGPTTEFPVAQRFSAEFKDRFQMIEIEIDEDIELHAAMAKGASEQDTIKAVEYVRKVRRNVKEQGISGVTISPRASQKMAANLAVGIPWDKAVKAAIRKGMKDEVWRKVA